MSEEMTPTPETNDPPEGNGNPPAKRSFSLPSAYTILFAIIVAVAALTWIIPAGLFQPDENGVPVPGSYTEVDGNPQGISDIILAPIDGMYGLRSAPSEINSRDEAETLVDQGTISVNNRGSLFGAIGVALFIMILGGFINVTMKTGALDAGIAVLATTLKDRSTLLISTLCIIFALGGTSFGLAEENVGFIAIIIPLMLMLGFDAMVAVSTVLIASGMGRIGGTVNPFSIGVASDSAGVSTGSGIALRLLILVVLVGMTILYTLRYANKVKADPSKSLIADRWEDHREHFLGSQSSTGGPLNGRQKGILAIFGFTFIVLIYSVIPWDEIGLDFIPTLGWFFAEFSGLFMIGAIAIGLVARFPERQLVSNFVSGVGDFVGPALIVALARGVTVIMHNGQITDTVLNEMSQLLDGSSSAFFAILMYLVNLPLAFLVPSSSGQAALAMPIMAPLADFADVPRSLVVTAFTAANATVNLISPASAVVMGVLGVARIGYGSFVKFFMPLLAATVLFLIVVIGITAIIS